MERVIDCLLAQQYKRRDVFKGIAKLGVVALGLHVAGQESRSVLEGKVETQNGIFYPLYEDHRYPVTTLPNPCDVYWREDVYGRLSEGVMTKEERIKKIINQGLPPLPQIFNTGVKIAFGDVLPTMILGFDRDKMEKLVSSIEANLPKFYVANLVLGLPLAIRIWQSPPITRRSILAVIGVFSVLTTSLIWGGTFDEARKTKLASMAVLRDMGNPGKDAIGRLAIKIDGIMTDLHPELTYTFFRNAVWAHKLLEISKHQKIELGRKPIFALGVGAGHGGVEDFLLVGQGIAERCITTYPSHWLKGIVEVNGGLEESSSVLITSIRDRNAVLDGSNIQFERFIDQPLMKALKSAIK